MIKAEGLTRHYGDVTAASEVSFEVGSGEIVGLLGLNGAGKTTFLHAVDFVLYGKFSNIFQSEGLSYENFLKKNINNENFDDGASIELKFHRRFKGKNQKFKIIRKWKENNASKIKEQFEAYVDGLHVRHASLRLKYVHNFRNDFSSFCWTVFNKRLGFLVAVHQVALRTPSR